MLRRLYVVAPLVSVALALALGCEDDPPPPPPPEPPPPPPPAVASPRPIATPAAFDLVATRNGALLAWGIPTRLGGGLRVLALDPIGRARGEEKPVVREGRAGGGGAAETIPPDAVEVAAAAGGGRLGLVWVLRDQTELSVVSALGDDGGETFGPPETLAPTAMARTGERGYLGAAASQAGEIAVVYRTDPGPCEDGRPEQCTRIFTRRLGGSEGGSGRGGVPMVIPDACPRAVVGDVQAGSSWYSAVCAIDPGRGRPAVTLYAIQFEPQYAQAVEILEGCDPRGLVPLPDGGVLAIGRCGSDLHAARLVESNRQLQELGATTIVPRCASARPVFEARGASGTVSVPLTAPVSRIEALLPEAIAPAGSRAVWTGESILVAVPIGAEVSLRRYACDGDAVTRSDTP